MTEKTPRSIGCIQHKERFIHGLKFSLRFSSARYLPLQRDARRSCNTYAVDDFVGARQVFPDARLAQVLLGDVSSSLDIEAEKETVRLRAGGHRHLPQLNLDVVDDTLEFARPARPHTKTPIDMQTRTKELRMKLRQR